MATNMRSFVHLHSSSRFDRSEASLKAACTRYNQDADLVTMTEVEFESRERAVREANGLTFGMVSGDSGHANDSIISYRRDRFRLLYKEMFKNSDRVVHRTDGHARDLPYTTIAVFEDMLTQKRVIVGVSHYASSVESELQKKHTRYGRVLQWRQSTRNSKRRINKLARRHRCDMRLVCGDWNINFKRGWVRALIKALAPAYRQTWRKTNVAGGTHGNRIIDATLVRGGRVSSTARLYPDDPSSDHRPYIERLLYT